MSTDTQQKLLMLFYGVVAFLAIVGFVLLIVDRAPKKGREKIQLVTFLAPAVVLVAVGLVIPAVRTTWLSFQGIEGNFIGFENYQWMFETSDSRKVLRNTFIWVAIAPIVATGIGLLYAIAVDKARGEAFAKALVFLPMAISFVGAGIIWRFMYAYRPEDGAQIGLLNQVLVSLGGEPKRFLQDAPGNTVFLIVVMIWVQAGFAMVVLSAAIKAISTDIIEAARLDGVKAWTMFRHVTLPSIRPAVIVVMTTISIATLKVFDIVRTMTGGNFETSVVANAMYDYSFRFGEDGKGSAFAVLLFVLVLPIVVYQVRQLRLQREIR